MPTSARTSGTTFDPFAFSRVQQTTTFGSASLSASLTLFNGFANHYLLRQAKYARLLTHATYRRIQTEVLAQALTQFFQTIGDSIAIELQRQRIERLSAQIQRLQAQVEAGQTLSLDLLSLEAQKAREEAQYITSTTAIEKTNSTSSCSCGGKAFRRTRWSLLSASPCPKRPSPMMKSWRRHSDTRRSWKRPVFARWFRPMRSKPPVAVMRLPSLSPPLCKPITPLTPVTCDLTRRPLQIIRQPYPFGETGAGKLQPGRLSECVCAYFSELSSANPSGACRSESLFGTGQCASTAAGSPAPD